MLGAESIAACKCAQGRMPRIPLPNLGKQTYAGPCRIERPPSRGTVPGCLWLARKRNFRLSTATSVRVSAATAACKATVPKADIQKGPVRKGATITQSVTADSAKRAVISQSKPLSAKPRKSRNSLQSTRQNLKDYRAAIAATDKSSSVRK